MYNFKENYLQELRKTLVNKKISKREIDEIIRDYDEMYDAAKENGYTDEEIYNKLGNPSDIADDLGGSFVDDINPYAKSKRGNVLVATSPIVATIAFLLLGFLGGYWNPGWLVFMWVPLASILFGSKKSVMSKLTSSSPFIALISFMILGHFGYWHPGWIVWLIIPLFGALSGIFSDQEKARKRNS